MKKVNLIKQIQEKIENSNILLNNIMMLKIKMKSHLTNLDLKELDFERNSILNQRKSYIHLLNNL